MFLPFYLFGMWLGADICSLPPSDLLVEWQGGQEETSTSQAGHKRGPTRGTHSASSFVSSLIMEELRTYCKIPNNIDMKLMENPDGSTLGGEHNAVFVT